VVRVLLLLSVVPFYQVFIYLFIFNFVSFLFLAIYF